MSFVLAPHETPGAGLTRVIQEQVAKLSVECVDAMQDASAFAHKARVRCKRVRAVLADERTAGKTVQFYLNKSVGPSYLGPRGLQLPALQRHQCARLPDAYQPVDHGQDL